MRFMNFLYSVGKYICSPLSETCLCFYGGVLSLVWVDISHIGSFGGAASPGEARFAARSIFDGYIHLPRGNLASS